jgi:hypothetical protein
VRQLRRHERCLNCDEQLGGDFCARCGQENTDYRVSLRRLLGDLADELFQLESRLWRSLWTLARRPGRLTSEYNAGRRVRYTTPLRLYLLTSVAYFALVSLWPSKNLHVQVGLDDQDRAELSQWQAPKSSLEGRLRDKVQALARLEPRELDRRLQEALVTNLPRALALLVPAFALLTMALFGGPRRFFVEHLVFALHLHAFSFLVLVVAALVRVPGADPLGVVILFVWMMFALRSVFAQSWLRTVVKGIAVATAYSIILAVAVAGATAVGLWFAPS